MTSYVIQVIFAVIFNENYYICPKSLKSSEKNVNIPSAADGAEILSLSSEKGGMLL